MYLWSRKDTFYENLTYEKKKKCNKLNQPAFIVKKHSCFCFEAAPILKMCYFTRMNVKYYSLARLIINGFYVS